MQQTLMAASMISITPAILFLLFSLKEYESYFDDRKIFLSFAGSLFAGMLVAFFHLVLTRYFGIQLIATFTFITVIVGIAVMTNFLFFIVLNLNMYGQKFDTTYYGAAFGFGVGAMVSVAQLFSFFEYGFRMNAQYIGSMLFYAVAVVLFHGAIGIYIGYGSYKRRPFKYFFYALLLSLPFNGLIFFWYWFSWTTNAYNRTYELANIYSGGWWVLLLALVWAIFVYRIMHTRIMPAALPEEKRRERRRAIRKRKRKRVTVNALPSDSSNPKRSPKNGQD